MACTAMAVSYVGTLTRRMGKRPQHRSRTRDMTLRRGSKPPVSTTPEGLAAFLQA